MCTIEIARDCKEKIKSYMYVHLLYYNITYTHTRIQVRTYATCIPIPVPDPHLYPYPYPPFYLLFLQFVVGLGLFDLPLVLHLPQTLFPHLPEALLLHLSLHILDTVFG